ncbi:hypothetical protein NEMBOFW57_002652 [Staphylotrichum longicolle]|uniref:Sm domain-containing protein n=1 Tax=Staphylotrichum longicolle TaxID=669026 RepID=A0AAD4F3Q9_9PEZI|nr:hypothetical protein NEMBOFW57_002652 [Staphylotrichum longicolle]
MSTTTANRGPSPTSSPPSDKEESAAYLRSLLNKNLRVTTNDNRMFWGAFKCTDSESNIVLQHTYEYRHPTSQQISAAAAAATTTTATSSSSSSSTTTSPPTATTVKLDMTARYLGLVVVPGKYIVRIEAEEFASQMRGREVRVLPLKQQQQQQQQQRGVGGSGSGALGGVGTAVGTAVGGVEVV